MEEAHRKVIQQRIKKVRTKMDYTRRATSLKTLEQTYLSNQWERVIKHVRRSMKVILHYFIHPKSR
jgi:hypothetical protein